MELPAEVLIHNEMLGMKGSRGTIIAIHSDGYYEINCPFGEKIHRVLMPIRSTVIIARDPEEPRIEGLEIEH